MLNSVLETRSVHDGLHAITLEIPEIAIKNRKAALLKFAS